MFTYKSEDGEKKTKIDSAVLITADSELTIFLARNLQAINKIALVDRFELKQTSDDAFSQFTYDITLKDGREWHQTLNFNAGPTAEPSMTFAVTDLWKLSEFALQRPLRDLIVKYVGSHGVTEIDVKWN